MRTYALLQDICSIEYGYCDPKKKNLLHSRGIRFLKELAKDLKLTNFNVRSNRAGIAVSGEITLISDQLYVSISQTYTRRSDLLILMRGVKHNKDYSGLRNREKYMATTAIAEVKGVCAEAIRDSNLHQEAHPVS